MPKPSLNPDRARQGGGAIEAGVYVVESAKYQNIKTDRKANSPHLVLEAAVCDKDGDKVKGADLVEIQFGFGAKSLEAFHPGQATGPDDADPKDVGDNVDAEGNTIYCAESEQFNKSCAAVVFAETLVKAGYPKDILDQTYAPNFVGLKFELATFDSATVNQKFGLRLNTRPMSDGGVVTYKVCVRWLNPNYLTDAKGGKSDAAKAGKTNGAAKAEAPAATDQTPEELAILCLAAVAEQRSGEKNAVKTTAQLVGLVTIHYTKAKYPAGASLKAVQAIVKDVAWAKEQVEMLGGEWFEGDAAKQVVFP